MLKVTPHESKGLYWWYEQYLNKKIDMAPPYQRKSEIWSKWKRAHLIDSIINDFDIPKFYVADFNASGSEPLNKKNQAFAIIDGKQRFGAIFDFFSDGFRLNASCIVEDQPDIKLGGLSYSEIVRRFPSISEKIDSYVPTVMNVAADKEHKIEELFVRLNMGEATTGAEKRNAMGGPLPAIYRELTNHPFFVNKVSFATKRMQEHNLAAKLFLLEFKDGFADTKAKNLNDLTAAASEWSAMPENAAAAVSIYTQARDRVYESLELLTREFDDQDPLLGRQGEIPIYYWVARMHPTWVNELRDFVLQFSKELLTNLRAQRAGDDVDNELAAYYTASRTTNDQASLESRYKIFVRRFSDFRKPGSQVLRRK